MRAQALSSPGSPWMVSVAGLKALILIAGNWLLPDMWESSQIKEFRPMSHSRAGHFPLSCRALVFWLKKKKKKESYTKQIL